jgi:transcriptional regulator with XRE-family HTH domain
MLRDHMGLSQTDFGSFLRVAQSMVSQWEGQRRDELLPEDLAENFAELWECFATRPTPEGFAEATAVLSEYRRRKAALPEPTVTEADPPSLPARTWPIQFLQGPLPADAKLVEMVPANPGLPSLTRMFAAVPRQEPSPEGEETQGTGGEKEGRGSGSRLLGRLRRKLHGRSGAVRRYTMVAALTVFGVTTGCMVSHGSGGGRRLRLLPSVEQAPTGGAEAPEPSMPMPSTPTPGQKRSPCASGEIEAVGGCWWKLEDIRPPCPAEYSVESAGRCLIPVPEKRKRPDRVSEAQ